MKGHRLLMFAALFVALSCDDARHPTGTLEAPTAPSKIIQDGAHGGNSNFFFQLPLVPRPNEPAGFAFNNRLRPALSVDICELTTANRDPVTGRPTATTPCLNPNNPLKRFGPGTVQLINAPRTQLGWWTVFLYPADGFYYVLWNTKDSRLDVNKFYRITVKLQGLPAALGIADVRPIRNLTQWQNSLTGELIQVIDKTVLPITFRVGQEALCEETESCTSATFSKDATVTQVLQLQGEGGGGAIAAVSVPPGALPANGPQNVTFNIGRVNVGSSGLVSPAALQEGGPTVCHPALPLQQFEGCFRITTTPELPLNAAGEMFTLPITVAGCFELHDSGDPREQFVQLWSSDVTKTPAETPRPLESTDASNLLGHDSDDCSENIIEIASSNRFVRVATAGLKKVQKGLGSFFGVKTAYGVDKGLGGLTKLISFISPAMTAEIRPYTDTELEFVGNGVTPITTTSTARIVGTRAHGHSPVLNVGIGGVPVTYTLAANGGSLRPVGNIEAPGLSSLTVLTNTNPIDESPTSGGGFAPVNWTLPTAPGIYTLTATGPALNPSSGPVTFTATVTAALAEPALSLSETEVILLAAGALVRYELAVTNHDAFPNGMFALAPDLPSCASEPARRTWVEVYNASNDNLVQRFCQFDNELDLRLFSFALPSGTAPAEVYVKIIDRQSGASSTSNNISLTTPAPDLVVSSGAPTLTPATLTTSGGTITISSWTIRNQGGNVVLGEALVQSGIYLSTDPIITTADTRLSSTVNLDVDLESGEFFNRVAHIVPVPAVAAGQYYIGILLDYSERVAESNEDNNYVSAPLTVVAPTAGNVSLKAPMPAPLYSHSVAVVGGTLYVVGGTTLLPSGAQAATSQIHAYNPLLNSWSLAGNLAQANSGLGTVVVDGVIYSVGGFSSGGAVSTVETFTPATGARGSIPDMPAPRGNAGVAVVDGIIYVMGGYTAPCCGSVSSVYAYDLAAGTWSTRSSMPKPRHFFATAVVNGIIYAIGGRDFRSDTGEFGTLSEVYAYNPATDTWSGPKVPMPHPSKAMSVGVIDGLIYVAAGIGEGVGLPYVDAYDPVNNVWIPHASLAAGRGITAGGVVNGVFYVLGGFVASGGMVATNEAFSP